MNTVEEIIHWLDGANHAALITNPVSRRYITGFESSDGTVVATKSKVIFIIDARYFEMAQKAVIGCEVVLQGELYKQLDAVFGENGIEKVSVESDYMTLSALSELNTRFVSVRFDTSSRLSDYMTGMRIIKSEDEIRKITAAQRIAEKAFGKLIYSIKPGMTEKQVAAALNFYMLSYGADGISFDTIAASGVNSACPHAVPTDKPLASGEFLTLDFGALKDGYHSDMTRTVVIGQPTEEMKHVYNAVWGANTDAFKAVRPEISCKLVDNVARSTLDAWGYEEYFCHGLGHGVGLEIHEAPAVNRRSSTTLHEGMVITIEPGVYIPGRFGVRIEDMCAVTKDGARNLTETQKTLISI